MRPNMQEVIRGLARGKPLARAWSDALEHTPQPVRIEVGDGVATAHTPEGRYTYVPALLPDGLRARLADPRGLPVFSVYLDARDREALRVAARRSPR